MHFKIYFRFSKMYYMGFRSLHLIFANVFRKYLCSFIAFVQNKKTSMKIKKLEGKTASKTDYTRKANIFTLKKSFASISSIFFNIILFLQVNVESLACITKLITCNLNLLVRHLEVNNGSTLAPKT